MSEHGGSEEARVVTRVALYTPSWVITGSLRTATPVRLSDLLNNWSEAFLPLDDARTVNLRDGRVESGAAPASLLVALGEILVLHEVPVPEAAARAGAAGMHVAKEPTTVGAYVGPLRIEGSLYMPTGANMAAYIDRCVGAFLPLTSVAIYPPDRERLGVVRVPFALVNRSHLVVGRMGKGALPPEAVA